jgi:hypothetical protein
MHVIRRAYTPSPRVSEPGETSVVPRRAAGETVSPYKLRKGIEAAKKDINDMIETISLALTDSPHVEDVELTVSFGPDGRLVGFGAGGAATIKIRFSPAKEG